MQVELPDRKKWNRTSASQIKAVARCEWRWIWEKLFGFRGPGSRATQRGQLIHKMLEDALMFGTPPGKGDYDEIETDMVTQDDWDRAPAIALKMLEHVAMEPGSVPKTQIEHKMMWKPEGSPVYILGFVDLVDGKQSDGAVGLTDYKTRSRIGRYTPTAMELRTDIQGLVYGAYAAAMAKPLDPTIWFRHINGQTTGSIISTEVTATWAPGEVITLFNKTVLPLINRQKVLADSSNEELLQVDGNKQACGDFRGCPHKSRCLTHGILEDHPYAAIFSGKQELQPMDSSLDFLSTDAPKTETKTKESALMFKFKDNDIVQSASGSRHTVIEAFSGPGGKPAYKMFDGVVAYEHEIELVPDEIDESVASLFLFAVGETVLTSDDREATISERLDHPQAGIVYKTDMGVFKQAKLSAITADPAEPVAPLTSAPNPPDGVPMDEVVVVEAKEVKAAKVRTRGFKVNGAPVSSLDKVSATKVQAALLAKVQQSDKYAEYEEQSKRPLSGRVTLAHNKKDISLIFVLLGLPDLTSEDLAADSSAAVIDSTASTHGRTLCDTAVVGQDEHGNATKDTPQVPASAGAQQSQDRVEEIVRLEKENTELRDLLARASNGVPSTLYVNCTPGHHVPAFTWAPLVEKFIAGKDVHPMCHSDYGTTGYHLMADQLRKDKSAVPHELYLDLGMLGGREALAVLKAKYDLVVRGR
tara:strand:- start:6116 stop:8215 length:2100 start_codon:yes stop_codon:yes gene_type:complete